jgi:hypothetical protein
MLNLALQIFERSNEPIYSVWNTTAGADSTPSVSGVVPGTYWASQPPHNALDNNQTSDYTSHGSCHALNATQLLMCGINTGFYLTLASGPFTLMGFYMSQSYISTTRDPMTITIEGSNLSGVNLTLGSSWSLIYNGSSGLGVSIGPGAIGTARVLRNTSQSFSSYRLLVTSRRSSSRAVAYSEFTMIGYGSMVSL